MPINPHQTGFRSATVVVPSDATVLTETAALWVGGAGNLAVRIGGVNVTFNAVPAGTLMPLKVDQVRATGTTATNIVALR